MAEDLFQTLTGYPPSGLGDGLLGGEPDGSLPPGAETEDDLLLGHEAATRPEDRFASILDEIEQRLDREPETVKKLADAFGIEENLATVKAYLAKSREIVERAKDSGTLGAEAAGVDYEEDYGADLLGAGEDFSATYVRDHVVERYWRGLPQIDLQPKLTRFEDDNALGVLGWLVFNGLDAIRVPRSFPGMKEQFGRIHGAADFLRHTPDDPFIDQLAAGDGGKTRIALFADFGTGLAHSRFIARQIDVDRYDAAVHLGDVYYTGTAPQYKNYFTEPLTPAMQNGTKLFVIPDNHDGYSGFHSYCDFLREHLQGHQRGSYFAIQTGHVQLIGVDTIWHSDRGRIQDTAVKEWLGERLRAGRASGKSNVLLTGHEPYDLGKDRLTKLHGDVKSLGPDLVDLWFWGNTHYCALYDRGEQTSFYGSCIGHAGYPYKKREKHHGGGSAAPVLFLEQGSRYAPTSVREDRGMNGFCSLEIEPNGDIQLRYVDWRGHDRCTARFLKQPGGGLLLEEDPLDHTADGTQ